MLCEKTRTKFWFTYTFSKKWKFIFNLRSTQPPLLFLFLLFCLIRRDLTHFSITFSPNYLIKLRLLTQSISISSRRNVFLHFFTIYLYIYIYVNHSCYAIVLRLLLRSIIVNFFFFVFFITTPNLSPPSA